MVLSRLLGGLGFLLVALLAIGSLLSMAMTLVGNLAAMMVLGLVLIVLLSLAGYGSSFDRGSPYW